MGIDRLWSQWLVRYVFFVFGHVYLLIGYENTCSSVAYGKSVVLGRDPGGRRSIKIKAYQDDTWIVAIQPSAR
jgi:hypothetical protein